MISSNRNRSMKDENPVYTTPMANKKRTKEDDQMEHRTISHGISPLIPLNPKFPYHNLIETELSELSAKRTEQGEENFVVVVGDSSIPFDMDILPIDMYGNSTRKVLCNTSLPPTKSKAVQNPEGDMMDKDKTSQLLCFTSNKAGDGPSKEGCYVGPRDEVNMCHKKRAAQDHNGPTDRNEPFVESLMKRYTAKKSGAATRRSPTECYPFVVRLTDKKVSTVAEFMEEYSYGDPHAHHATDECTDRGSTDENASVQSIHRMPQEAKRTSDESSIEQDQGLTEFRESDEEVKEQVVKWIQDNIQDFYNLYCNAYVESMAEAMETNFGVTWKGRRLQTFINNQRKEKNLPRYTAMTEIKKLKEQQEKKEAADVEKARKKEAQNKKRKLSRHQTPTETRRNQQVHEELSERHCQTISKIAGQEGKVKVYVIFWVRKSRGGVAARIMESPAQQIRVMQRIYEEHIKPRLPDGTILYARLLFERCSTHHYGPHQRKAFDNLTPSDDWGSGKFNHIFVMAANMDRLERIRSHFEPALDRIHSKLSPYCVDESNIACVFVTSARFIDTALRHKTDTGPSGIHEMLTIAEATTRMHSVYSNRQSLSMKLVKTKIEEIDSNPQIILLRKVTGAIVRKMVICIIAARVSPDTQYEDKTHSLSCDTQFVFMGLLINEPTPECEYRNVTFSGDAGQSNLDSDPNGIMNYHRIFDILKKTKTQGPAIVFYTAVDRICRTHELLCEALALYKNAGAVVCVTTLPTCVFFESDMSRSTKEQLKMVLMGPVLDDMDTQLVEDYMQYVMAFAESHAGQGESLGNCIPILGFLSEALLERLVEHMKLSEAFLQTFNTCTHMQGHTVPQDKVKVAGALVSSLIPRLHRNPNDMKGPYTTDSAKRACAWAMYLASMVGAAVFDYWPVHGMGAKRSSQRRKDPSVERVENNPPPFFKSGHEEESIEYRKANPDRPPDDDDRKTKNIHGLSCNARLGSCRDMDEFFCPARIWSNQRDLRVEITSSEFMIMNPCRCSMCASDQDMEN